MTAKNKKKIVRVFFDTETYTNYKGISLPYLIGWVTDLDIEKFCYSLEPHDDFFNVLAQLSVDYDVQLWAHNVQYDLGIIYPTYLAKLPHNSIKIWQVSERNDFIRFRYIGKGVNKIKFSAHCTYRWKKGSLKLWADELKIKGLEKGDIDYEKKGYCKVVNGRLYYLGLDDVEKSSSLDSELSYLKNDVFILYKIYERIVLQKSNIMDLFYINFQTLDPKTVPSFGAYLLNRIMGGSDKNNIYNKVYKTTVDKEIGTIMENTRMGGFTAYNRNISELIFETPDIKSYDMNSDYPWIMTQGLPFGPLIEEKKRGYIPWHVCKIKKIKWKEEYSFFSREPVPLSYKKGKVFMCQMFLNLLEDVTDIEYDIEKTYYQEFKVRNDMLKLVETLFSVKSNKNLDAITRDAAKVTMNSQYGKFMQRNFHVDYFYNLEKGFFEEYHPDTPRGYKSNLTGCYIVQVAQSILIHHVIEEHEKGNTFVYCDTDSVKIVEKVEPSFSIGDSLGDWKFEGEYHIYMNNGKAKKYFLWNHDYPINKQQIKMSGIYNAVKSEILGKFSLSEYQILYSRVNNVKVIGGTKTSCNGLMGQKIIGTSDIEFNRGKPVTHILDIKKDKHYLIKYEEK